MGSEYVHVMLNLVGVMGLMALLFFLAKKFKFARHATNKHMKILHVLPLGSKEKIMLLEVNNTFLLLGVTPNHIETLYSFSELSSLTESTPVMQKKFSELMSTVDA